MKNFLIALFALGASMSAVAAPANLLCDGKAGGDKKVTATNTDDAPMFIKSDFTMKCSANVFLGYDETATYVSVGAASVKGKNQFGGTSEGGSVKQIGECSGGKCTEAPTPPEPTGGSS